MLLLQSSKSFAFVIISLFFISFSSASQAQERLIKGAPAQLTPLPTPGAVQREDANLIVDDIMVDRTAANAVVAREQALNDVRREAFRKLAERHMTPGAYANFRMPDDRTIAGLVQDFEIKGEQLSTTRYVGKFSVRFRDGVRSYINIPAAPRDVVTQPVTQPWRQLPGDAGTVQAGTDTVIIGGDEDGMPGGVSTAQRTAGGMGGMVAQATSRQIVGRVAAPSLLLPYYENMSGKTILWEDPNPWRDAWQRMPGGAGVNNQALNNLVVPLGDISDISAGPSDAVWSGDYRTLEKLQKNYGVSQVVLAVANKSGAHMTIDLYFYQKGQLQRRSALTPYAGDRPEAEAWHQAMSDVLDYFQRPAPAEGAAAAQISRSLLGQQQDTPAQAQQARPSLVTLPYDASIDTAGVPAAQRGSAQAVSGAYGSLAAQGSQAAQAGDQEIEAMLSFNDFNAWMNVQRRFSAMSPPVRIDIRSLSRNTARFVMRYQGSVPVLQNALAAQGIVMTPSREVTTDYGSPVYDLRFHP